MSTFAEIVANLSMDASGFTGGLADAQKGLFRFVHMAESVGNAIMGVGQQVITAGLEMGQAIDEAEIAIANMASSTEEATKFMGELRDFAVQTPFAFDKLTTEVRKLQGAGIDLEDVIPILTIFGDHVSAMATGADGLKHLVKAFTDMKSAGKIMTSDMNQMANAGVKAWQILADKLGTSVAGAREKVRKEFVSSKGFIEAVMKDMMTTTGGQMNKILGTLGGSWESLKEGASLAIADGLKPFREALVALIPVFAETAASAGTFILPVVDGLVYLTDVTTKTLDLFNHMPDYIQQGTFAMLALAAASIIAAGALAGVFFALSTVASSVIAIGTVIATIGLPEIILITAGLAAMAIMAVNVVGAWAVLALVWANDWYGIRTTILNTLNTIGTGIVDFVTSAIEAFDKLPETVINRWIDVLQSLYDIVDAVSSIPNAVGLPSIFDIPQEGLDQVLTSLKKVKEIWANDTGSTASELGDLKDHMIENLTSGLGDAATNIEQSFKLLIDGPLKDLFLNFIPDDVRAAFNEWMSGKESVGAEGKKMLEEWLVSFLAKWTDGAGTSGKGKKPSAHETEMAAVEKDLFGGEESQILKQIDEDARVAFDNFHVTLEELAENAERFKEVMGPEVDKMVDEWEKSIKEASHKAAVIGGLDILKDMFGEFSGEMSMISNSIKAFGPQMGAFAGFIGVVIVLITKTAAFKNIIDTMNEVMDYLVDTLDRLQAPLNALINTVGDILKALIDFGMALGLAQALENGSATAARFAAAIQPFLTMLQSITAVFQAGASRTGLALHIIDAAMFFLYNVFKGIALIIMAVVLALESVWNGILDVLASFAHAIGLNKLEDSIDSMKADTDAMADSMGTLMDQSWEDAKNLAMHSDVVADSTDLLADMNEELSNVPEGYKVALARFNAAAATGPGHPTGGGGGTSGGTGGTGGGGRGGLHGGNHGGLSAPNYVPYAANGAIVKKKTLLVAGEAGPEAIVPLGRRGMGMGSSIVINNLTIITDDPEEMLEQLTALSDRKALVRTGRVTQSVGPRFVTR